MAARLRPEHSKAVRDKIQASALITRLHNCAMGTLDLTTVQVNAINSLLDRSVPKLSQIQHTGDADNPIRVETITRRIVHPEHKLPAPDVIDAVVTRTH
jgi:hypothetical protein